MDNRRNDFMISLQEIKIGHARIRTCDAWICSRRSTDCAMEAGTVLLNLLICTHVAVVEFHCPFDWHSILLEPTSLNPLSQDNVARYPKFLFGAANDPLATVGNVAAVQSERNTVDSRYLKH